MRDYDRVISEYEREGALGYVLVTSSLLLACVIIVGLLWPTTTVWFAAGLVASIAAAAGLELYRIRMAKDARLRMAREGHARSRR